MANLKERFLWLMEQLIGGLKTVNCDHTMLIGLMILSEEEFDKRVASIITLVFIQYSQLLFS